MQIRCLECGEQKALRGERLDRGIRVTCGSCGNVWLRTPDRCDECGATTVEVRVPLLQKSRGVQQSIVGYRTVHECTSCGAATGSTAPPENYRREDA